MKHYAGFDLATGFIAKVPSLSQRDFGILAEHQPLFASGEAILEAPGFHASGCDEEIQAAGISELVIFLPRLGFADLQLCEHRCHQSSDRVPPPPIAMRFGDIGSDQLRQTIAQNRLKIKVFWRFRALLRTAGGGPAGIRFEPFGEYFEGME